MNSRFLILVLDDARKLSAFSESKFLLLLAQDFHYDDFEGNLSLKATSTHYLLMN